MALINCPECQHEVSDTVKACPHCGYSIAKEEPTKVEVTSVSFKSKNPKKLLKVVVAIVALIVVVAVSLSLKAKNDQKISEENSRLAQEEYVNNLILLMDTSFEAASTSEDVIVLATNVWRDTIYKTRNEETSKYTMSGNSFRDDFNDSIASMYEDNIIKVKVNKAIRKMDELDLQMKLLNNPPEGLEMCYSTAQTLYTTCQGIVDLAESPKGNLDSFTTAKSEKIDKYLEAYKLLNTQIPDNDEL